jgi:sugar/nucleoside kinase (ribokinase family)
MKPRYDITFVGHVCYDEITSPAGETTVRPGSAVLCGAMVSARVHARTAVITKMNPRDDGIVAPLRDLGADLYVIPTEVTTFARVVHPSHDVDERRLYVMRDPGPFTIGDVPAGLETDLVHLAGISNHEFTLDFIRDLHKPFTNRNQSGRTGRGDTTISAYLARRKTHPPTEALRFAAALASIKMETPGPFAGTLADVEERMQAHRTSL